MTTLFFTVGVLIVTLEHEDQLEYLKPDLGGDFLTAVFPNERMPFRTNHNRYNDVHVYNKR